MLFFQSVLGNDIEIYDFITCNWYNFAKTVRHNSKLKDMLTRISKQISYYIL